MSRDVQILIVIPKTLKALTTVLATLDSSERRGLLYEDRDVFHVAGKTYAKDWILLSINTHYRYYEDGYETASWPAIRALLEKLRRQLKGVAESIIYADDIGNDGCKVTPKMLREYTKSYKAWRKKNPI
jgi:hypothetical protein